MISRQQRYRQRHAEMGLCERCPLPIWRGGLLCKKHRDHKMITMRTAKGCQPWRPGGRGRPPLNRATP